MINLDRRLSPRDLRAENRAHVRAVGARRFDRIEETWRPEDGAPVFTVEGRYRARGWTEWTQGFQFGSALLQFDATGDARFSSSAASRTIERMAPHLTHVGVHDHGFNNVSTYGTLWRLAREGRIEASEWERRFYELALQVSGAVQARALDAAAGRRVHPFVQRRRIRCSSTRSGRCARSRWRTCSASR